MSKARRAFVHGPPGGTLADLRLRPACRLNPDPKETFVASNRTAGNDVKQSCVRPFLALRMRRRMSNPWFEHLRQSDSPHLGDAADNQIAASVVGPRGERQIAAAL